MRVSASMARSEARSHRVRRIKMVSSEVASTFSNVSSLRSWASCARPVYNHCLIKVSPWRRVSLSTAETHCGNFECGNRGCRHPRGMAVKSKPPFLARGSCCRIAFNTVRSASLTSFRHIARTVLALLSILLFMYSSGPRTMTRLTECST